MDKSEIESLAGKVQQAVASYDPSDSSSWIPIQDAIEELGRATEPPHVFLMKQRFHVRAAFPSVPSTIAELTDR